MNNPQLPAADKQRVEESLKQYQQWRQALEAVEQDQAVATSRDLKIAIPSSLYFLVCEFLDMTPVSIISTQIDAVLIVRKSKRLSANIRKKYKTPQSRKQHRKSYVDFLDESKYYPDVFQIMINKIQTLINDTVPEIDRVLERGHF